MRHAGLSLALALAIALFSTPTAHAAPLLRGFGGPAGFGANVLPSNDDGYSSAIDLTGAFPSGLRFFGGPYSRFFVNNNGNITFGSGLYEFTAARFPLPAARNNPMIAPYWADVDTRNRSVADPAENLVYWHLEPGRLIVTWYNVGYYNSRNDKRMSFQLIITNTLDCGSGDFDVEFRYDRCEWTTGDASGGTNGFGGTRAQAGFDAGNVMDYVALPGSFTDAVLDVCTTSNVGQPGIWQFAVRSGGVVCPEAGQTCVVDDAVGACAVGRTQCVGSDIVCQPAGSAAAERCDGIDNDCDGDVDEGGRDLCSGGDVCVRGSCVPPCFEGSCLDGFFCAESGACVESACEDVTCPTGERCVGGTCVDVCAGVVCPYGQACISGRCADPCESVTCDGSQVCRDGLCVPSCPCLPCPSGEVCSADGTCTPAGCDIVICSEGYFCAGGRCVEACEGVVCPTGQLCNAGACVEASELRDAGMPNVDGGVDDGGMVDEEDAGTGEMDAGTADAGREPPPPASRGCDCRVATPSSHSGFAWALPILAVGLALIRRRRR